MWTAYLHPGLKHRLGAQASQTGTRKLADQRGGDTGPFPEVPGDASGYGNAPLPPHFECKQDPWANEVSEKQKQTLTSWELVMNGESGLREMTKERAREKPGQHT